MSLLGAPTRVTGSRHVAAAWHHHLSPSSRHASLPCLRAAAACRGPPHVAPSAVLLLSGHAREGFAHWPFARKSFLRGRPLPMSDVLSFSPRTEARDCGCLCQPNGVARVAHAGQHGCVCAGQGGKGICDGDRNGACLCGGQLEGCRGGGQNKRMSTVVVAAAGATAREARGMRGAGDGSAIETPEELLALKDKKKMRVALLVGYLGTEFKGLQKQEDSTEMDTIEAYLEAALFKVGSIRPSNYGQLSKVGWSRSSRTDKGVHSLVTIVSLKMLVDQHAFDDDAEGREIASRINEHLPHSIHVFACVKVARSFNARKAVQSRTYEYMVPAESILGHRLSLIAVAPPGTRAAAAAPTPNLGQGAECHLAQGPSPRGQGTDQLITDQEVCGDGEMVSDDQKRADGQVVTEGQEIADMAASAADERQRTNPPAPRLPLNVTVTSPLAARARLDAMSPAQVALELEHFRAVLRQFEGVHAFHNFTKRRLYRDTFFERRRARAPEQALNRDGQLATGGTPANETSQADSTGGLQRIVSGLRAFLFGKGPGAASNAGTVAASGSSTATRATTSLPSVAARSSASAAPAAQGGSRSQRALSNSDAISSPPSAEQRDGMSDRSVVDSVIPNSSRSPESSGMPESTTPSKSIEASSAEASGALPGTGERSAGKSPAVPEKAGRRANGPRAAGDDDEDSSSSASAADSNEEEEGEGQDEEDEEEERERGEGTGGGGGLAPQYGSNGEPLLSRRKPIISWSDVIDPEDQISKRHFRRIFQFTCSDVEVVGGRPIVRIIVSGNSFLLNQIRCMVGVSMAVAQGYFPPDIVPLLLAKQVRANVPKAPPQNLFLASSVFNFARRQTHAGAVPDPDDNAGSPFRSQRVLEIGPVAQQAILEYRDRTMLPGIISLVDAPGSVWSYWISGWMERQTAYPAEDLASAFEQYRAWLARKALSNQEAPVDEEYID